GDDDRAVAPDLRGDARPLPRSEDLRGPRWRLPAVVRGALRRDLRDLPRPVPRQAQQEADGVSAPALLRLARVHARSPAASGRGGRLEPDRDGHRLSVPVDAHLGRPHPGHARPERRRARRDSRWDSRQAPEHQVVDRIWPWGAQTGPDARRRPAAGASRTSSTVSAQPPGANDADGPVSAPYLATKP